MVYGDPFSWLAKWHAAKKLLQQLVSKQLLEHVHSPKVERDARSHYVLPAAFRKTP